MTNEWDGTPWAGAAVPMDYWSLRSRRIQEERLNTRAIDSFANYPGLTEQLLRVQGLSPRPWRAASIREALGVPAIFRAVALISNTTGSLAVEAYRKGRKLTDDDTPRVIQRPDPFRTPRDFYRDTAFYIATRGEAWWWVGARDGDGSALSLIVVPPWEVTITETKDRLRPIIKWKDREMRREDMRHITFLPDETGYRGIGPLQVCGAAASVAVESQEWAANFYATGGNPSVNLHSEVELVGNEAEDLRNQWMATPPNMPQVTSGPYELREVPRNEHGAQMLDARMANNGDAARMYGIPGALLEYGRDGSSVTYQNVTEVFTLYVKVCLAPDYLEAIEQEMSDLLPRSTTARFNVKGFERADVKTRWQVYETAVKVIGQDEAAAWAREQEGFEPGDVEYAPVPFAPPAAVPSSLPINTRSAEPVRCDGTRLLRGVIRPCGKLLAEAGPFVGTCPRCRKAYEVVAA